MQSIQGIAFGGRRASHFVPSALSRTFSGTTDTMLVPRAARHPHMAIYEAELHHLHSYRSSIRQNDCEDSTCFRARATAP